jgi:hypothetical protein
MSKYVVDKLMDVVRAMRVACDDAERAINEKDMPPLLKASRVIHVFSWAWANASTNIECVHEHVTDQIEIDNIKRGEAP